MHRIFNIEIFQKFLDFGHSCSLAPAGAKEGSLIWFVRTGYGQNEVMLPLGLGAEAFACSWGCLERAGAERAGCCAPATMHRQYCFYFHSLKPR